MLIVSTYGNSELQRYTELHRSVTPLHRCPHAMQSLLDREQLAGTSVCMSVKLLHVVRKIPTSYPGVDPMVWVKLPPIVC